MPYILRKTNGDKLVTIADGALNIETDLAFVGKNYAGYGEALNQNMLKLLENFATPGIEPKTPIRGQIWYDYSVGSLKAYTGTTFKRVARLEVSQATAQPNESAAGDLWWDSTNAQLKVFNGVNYALVAGASNAGTQLKTNSAGEVVDMTVGVILDNVGSGTPKSVIKHTVRGEVIAVTSVESFGVHASDPLFASFPTIKRGITLSGANAVTGVTSSTSYVWATAADSARLNGRPSTDYMLTSSAGSLIPTTFSTLTVTTLTSSVIKAAPGGGQFQGTWSLSGATFEATYADIAERYAADSNYPVGSVMVIGGSAEVTITTTRADPAVAGVISNGYAHLLNASAGLDATHPAIALAGRVPCKVVGPITKGDLLVSSDVPGHAERWKPGDSESAVIGKALKSTTKMSDVITIKV